MFLGVKTKLYAIGAALISAMGAVIAYLNLRNRQLKDQRDQLEADIEFKEDVEEADAEIRQEFSHRAEEARRDISNDTIPEHLRNPKA